MEKATDWNVGATAWNQLHKEITLPASAIVSKRCMMLEVTEAIKEHRGKKAKGEHGFDFCLLNCLTQMCLQQKKTTNTEYKMGVMMSRFSNIQKIQIVSQHMQLCPHPGFPWSHLFSLHLDLTMHIFLVPYLEKNKYFDSH